MARIANRFTKGSGVYTCRCCGYRTRDTGRGDNECVEMCADCYDLSGEENHLNDCDKLYSPQNVLCMIERVEQRTGKTDLWAHLRDQAFKQMGINPAAGKQPLDKAQTMHMEAVAQDLLSTYAKFASSIQSHTNRKLFCDIVESARVNANDTVYTERASNDWKAIFLGTIESELCFLSLPGTEKQRELTLKHLRAYFAKVA